MLYSWGGEDRGLRIRSRNEGRGHPKVCNVARKRLFDQTFFTIKSDVKPSYRTNVLILFD